MATTTKAIARPAQQAGMPAFYNGVKDLGTDTIGSEDLVIPRIKICQPTSAAAKEAIENIKDGEFYDSVNKTNFGKSIEFYTVMFYRSRVWFSKDFKLQATEFIDPITKQKHSYGNEPEVMTDNYEDGKDSFNYFLVLKADLERSIAKGGTPPAFYVFSMISAALSSAKQLNSKVKMNSQEGLPIWGQLVKASTLPKKFEKGTAYMPQFTYPDILRDQDGATVLMKFYNTVRTFVSKAEKQAATGEAPVEAETSAHSEEEDL